MSDPSREQLMQALRRADAAGDVAAAKAIAKRLSGSAPQEAEYDPTEGMSRLDHGLVGMGRGFTELGQGAKQLGLNVAAAVAEFFDPQERTLSSLITGQQPKSGIRAKADAYNRNVAAEAAQYERDLGDSGWANAGRIGS